MCFSLLKRKPRLELTITARDSLKTVALQTEVIGEPRADDIRYFSLGVMAAKGAAGRRLLAIGHLVGRTRPSIESGKRMVF